MLDVRAAPAHSRAALAPTLFRVLFALSLCLALAPAGARAQGGQLIVRLTADAAKSALTPKTHLEKIGRAAGVPLEHLREMTLDAHVVAVDGARDVADAEAIAARLAADPAVEFAQVDYRRHALQSFPNDQYLTTQHYLPNDPAAISAFSAWEVTFGSSSTVVAVIDTGYRPHTDLTGRLLPGYDMISNAAVANDGDGRDPDPIDPGNFLLASELTGIFADCSMRFSNWHGTSVAGIIAARSNNGAYLAGINAMILPVRVLGKCGGRDYRVFSNRPDANHRYMVDRPIRDAMAGKGWLPEGDGPNLVVMCAPV